MSLLLRSPAGRTKPARRVVSFGRTAPEWQWVWRGLVMGFAFWEGVPESVDLSGHRSGALTAHGTPSVEAGPYGMFVRCVKADSDGLTIDSGPIPSGASGEHLSVEVFVRPTAENSTTNDNSVLLIADEWMGTMETDEVIGWRTFGGNNVSGSSLTWEIDAWQHVVWAWEAGTEVTTYQTLYPSGVTSAETVALGDTSGDSGNSLEIARRGTSTDGRSDDIDVALVLIYDRLLTDDEVRRKARSPFGWLG